MGSDPKISGMDELNKEEEIAASILHNLVSSNSFVVESDNEKLGFENAYQISPYLHNVISKVHTYCPPIVRMTVGPVLDKTIYYVCAAECLEDSIVKINDLVQILSTSIKDRDIIFKIETVLKSAVVYLFTLLQNISEEDMGTVDDFIRDYSQYPLFANSLIDPVEINYLVIFRYMMKKALQIIPPERNKKLLLTICSYLEGSGRSYITGGTQSIATSRRIMIFQHESGCRKHGRCYNGLNRFPEPKVKLMTTCECGSVILKRTIWKHNRSKKHLQFVASLSTGSSSSSDELINEPITEQALPQPLPDNNVQSE